MNHLRALLDLIFPPLCFTCNKRLKNKNRIICTDCNRDLVWLKNVCPVCGNKLERGHCSYCSSNDWYFDRTVSLFAYTNVVQKLIHALKYKDLIRIVNLFREYLIVFLNNKLDREQVDIVTPVPIHRVRRRSRGYNQAELISTAVADILEKPHLPHLLRRIKYTKTQTKLNREERKRNVAAVFSINKASGIQGKNILLVDDVFTTGSTVNSISGLLKEEGCEKVFVLTISHA